MRTFVQKQQQTRQSRPLRRKKPARAAPASARSGISYPLSPSGHDFSRISLFASRPRGATSERRLEAAIARRRGGGAPLPGALRTPLEQTLRADFSRVRIHADAPADALNRRLQARAFTTGRDIFFKAGAFSPGTPAGRRLLAHELTHVVQQNAPASTVVQRQDEETEEPPRLRPRAAVAQARTNGANALDHSIARVQEAIREHEQGNPLPDDVQAALARFFPNDTPDFLPLLLRRIRAARRIIERVRVRPVVRRADPSIDPLGVEINTLLSLRPVPPAAVIPPGRPRLIVLFRRFFSEPELQATRFVHECFHYFYPTFIHHSRRSARGDAFAYQGFVSMLAGLPQRHPLERYPAPAEAQAPQEAQAPEAQEAP